MRDGENIKIDRSHAVVDTRLIVDYLLKKKNHVFLK